MSPESKIRKRTNLLKDLTLDDEKASTAVVSLLENVIDPDEADDLLRQFSSELSFQVASDNFGLQSRPTCYYADSAECIFSYVGLTLVPRPWTATLQRLRDRVAAACNLGDQHISLTACLVNYYPPKEGFIPWHYDEVRAHGSTKTVASLSLGGPRRFRLRRRDHSQTIVSDLLLPSGSVLLMQGTTQEEFEHSLPLDSNDAPPRISLTFRSIEPGWEEGDHLHADACCSEPPEYSKTNK